jgi:hypothetical protein
MAKIFLLILAFIAATLAWQRESFQHALSQQALPKGIAAADLSTISQDLESLTATVNAYAGGMLDGFTVLKSERALIRDLESSTIKAENMHHRLDKQDAKALLEFVRKLVPVVEGTLDAIAKKAPELRSAGMDRQAISHLKKLEVMVEEYGNSLVAQMPDWERRGGKDMLAWIMEKFDQTIEQLQ